MLIWLEVLLMQINTSGNPIGKSVFGLAYCEPWLMQRGIPDFFVLE